MSYDLFMDMLEKFYTIQEVADLLRVSKPTVYRLMAEGKLKSVSPTNRRRTLFAQSELDRFIKEMKGEK